MMFYTSKLTKSLHINTAALFLIASSCTLNAAADTAQHGLGLYINGFGLGAAYHYKFNEKFQVRGVFSNGDAGELDTELSSLEYEGDYDTSSYGAFLDWYPMSHGRKRNIFFTLGLMSLKSEFTGHLESIVGDDLSIGGTRVNSSDINGADLNIHHDRQLSPYVGVGFGNRMSEKRVSFMLELGFIHLDDPDVILSIDDPNGLVSPANIEAERQDIIDDSSGISSFASFGITYHF